MLPFSYFTKLGASRNRSVSLALNVLGLAVGLAICALITLYVTKELSYDDFHSHSDRLYRVVTDLDSGEDVQKLSLTPQPIGPLLKETRAEVDHSVRLFDARTPTVRIQNRTHLDRRFFFAEPSFFDVFSFELLKGEPESALGAPSTVVLTESTSRTYFGDEAPLGQSLNVDGSEYIVTGVIEDLPSTTHLQFDGLFSYSSINSTTRGNWGNVNAYLYVVLRSGVSPEAFEASIAGLVDEATGGRFSQILSLTPTLYLQHVPDIHLHSDRAYEISVSGNAQRVYLFGVVALLVLLMGCFNYVNIATAQAADRAHEVGVRKTVGATHQGLIGQFLTESMVTVAMAAVLAIGLVSIGLPVVNSMAQTSLTAAAFLSPFAMIASVLVLGFIAVLSGIYPAFVLSRFDPVQVLRKGPGNGAQGHFLRRVLVTLQFVVAVALLIGVGVVANQFVYMQSRSLGFDDERVLVTDLRGLPSASISQWVSSFKHELSRHPSIEQISLASSVPGRHVDKGLMVSTPQLPEGEMREIHRLEVDRHYLSTLQISLIAGRELAQTDFESGGLTPALINATAVTDLGWTSAQNAIGGIIQRPSDGLTYQIVGVLDDYHHFSMHQAIKPTLFRLDPSGYQYAMLKVGPGQTATSITTLSAFWKKHHSAFPFRFSFLDDDFERQYQAERRLSALFGSFSALALLVACLGLFGLTTYTTRRRAKEVGIRKVLGASRTHIVGLLSREVLILVGISFLIAVPLVFFLARRWLQGFAFPAPLNPWIFLTAGFTVAILALLTVGYHSLRTASSDPTRVL